MDTTEHRIACGTAHLFAIALGAGRPMVFLHAGVADTRMWWDALSHFAETHRAIAYDRRGFGQTECADAPFAHVADLAALLDHFGAADPILVGCSQGGRIAVDFALAHPGRVGALVLAAPAISGARAPQRYPPDISALVGESDAAEASGDAARINHADARLWLDGPLAVPGRVTGPLRALFLEMNRVALDHPPLTREDPPPCAIDRLCEIAAPTLVVCGDLDFPHIQDRSALVAERIPNAEFAILDGCAHLANMERPDRFNGLVADFLDART